MLRYAITDRAQFPGDEQTRQAELAAHWSKAGIDFVQLREKDLDPGALATLARRIQAALWSAGPGIRLLINSRADIALATHADGVHLTSAPGSLTPVQIRQLYAAASQPAPIISLSCHTLVEVAQAATAEPSRCPTLILFGPVFEKRLGDSLISEGTGLDLLRQACTLAAPTPVLALGGITEENTPACLAVGAAGIAAVRLFAAHP